MTHRLLGDLRRDLDGSDIVIVDNGGDYPALDDEVVLRPPSNLGWAGGTNYGTGEGARPHHVAFLWLNNDTRLSKGFVAGLTNGWKATGAGVVGPFYDCYWQHQRLKRIVPVDRYIPRPVHFRAPFVDGTCMFVPATTVGAIGLLDDETFGPVGWGAEIDFGLRVRAAQLDLAVTRFSYLHHEKSVTARTVFGGSLEEYATLGHAGAADGLRRKWGDDWQQQAGIDPATRQTAPLERSDRLGGSRRWLIAR